MEKVDVIIIGAGVIGLAVASELSDQKKTIFILEKEERYGTGISSRNSEVIHAGIYYPHDSLKAKLCVEGRKLLYSLSEQGAFPTEKRGKLIFARNDRELDELEKLIEKARANGVEDVLLLTEEEVIRKEPRVKNIKGALFSPQTGVTSAHDVMDYYYHKAAGDGADLVCGIDVHDIEKTFDGFKLIIKDNSGEILELTTGTLINAAGLGADTIAKKAGFDIEKHDYMLSFCKGDYFHVSGNAKNHINHLLYPVPSAKAAGLGIHTTIDLAGELRLGPDATYIPKEEQYIVSESKKDLFHHAVADVLPFINKDDLTPDFAGIRPKLQLEGGEFRDFIIAEETEKGFPGFINLIGIESPGLTASPAIARYVKELVEG